MPRNQATTYNCLGSLYFSMLPRHPVSVLHISETSKPSNSHMPAFTDISTFSGLGMEAQRLKTGVRICLRFEGLTILSRAEDYGATRRPLPAI